MEIYRKMKKQDKTILVRDFPIKSEATGWHFRIIERSAGAYTIEGRDAWGREIGLQGSDPDALLAAANCEAIKLSSRNLSDDSLP